MIATIHCAVVSFNASQQITFQLLCCSITGRGEQPKASIVR